MEIKHRGGMRTRAQFGFVKNLGAILRKAAAVRLGFLHDGIAADMLAAEYLPYKAIETYRAIQVDFELKRSRALAELLCVARIK